jgi:hypothetical protein
VVATLEDQDLEAQLVGAALCDREAEETGPYNDEIYVHTQLLGGDMPQRV